MARLHASDLFRLLVWGIISTPVAAQVTERVSVGESWIQADKASFRVGLTADGARACFATAAGNLVPGDSNGTTDVVLGEVGVPGSLILISAGTNGLAGNAPSLNPDMSADGNVIVFESSATNLVPGVSGTQIYVRDISTGVTSVVSVNSSGNPGDSESRYPVVSADGMVVAFSSGASNLVPGDTNGKEDVFVHDRGNGQTHRVSVSSGGGQGNDFSVWPALSGDGRLVSYSSGASNLVAGDTNGKADIFVHDRSTGTTTMESVASSGILPNGFSHGGSLSDDGRYIAFHSEASNLVPGDTNGDYDIFVRDRLMGITTRVVEGLGGAEPNNHSFMGTLSGSGRFLAFESQASNLVPNDTNGDMDFFLLDLSTASIQRVNVDSQGTQVFSSGTAVPQWLSVSADGRFVGFDSMSTGLVPNDSNGAGDAFVRDTRGCPPARTFYEDADGDGFGTATTFVVGCSPPAGYVIPDSDCNDADFSAHPGGSESCNDVDDDCDGLVDEDFLESYCTAKVNSQGCTPVISYSGNPTWSGADDFFVTATSVINHKPGILIWSLTQDSNSFGGGILCVGAPIERTPGQHSGGTAPPAVDCSGTYSFHFSQTYMLQHLLPSNTTVFAQYWSRDPAFPPPNGIGLTGGLKFTICP